MKSLALNAVVLTLTWLAGLVAVRVLEPAPLTDVALVLVYLVALVAAIALRAEVAAFVQAGFLTYFVVSLAAHLLWGPHAVQGQSAHMAVIGAGFLGIALGRGTSTDFVRRHLSKVLRHGAGVGASGSSLV